MPVRVNIQESMPHVDKDILVPMTQSKLFNEKTVVLDLEQLLWKAADILRGAFRLERYGNYVLPLLFFKRFPDG